MLKHKQHIDILFDHFIEESKFAGRLSNETIRGYSASFNNFRKVMPEIINPDMLTTNRLTEFFKRLQLRERNIGKGKIVTGVKPSTLKTHFNRLKAFYSWLEKTKHIEVNAFIEYKVAQPTYEDRRSLEKNDIQKIITSIVLHSHNSLLLKRDITMVHILLLCGLRRNELISLHVTDVDLERRLLKVNGKTSKSKRTRFIPINPTLEMYLKDYFEERNKHGFTTEYLLVSSTRDRGFSISGINQWVKKQVKLAGVNFHLHMFRHTFACNLANNNVSIVKIQKLLGHADIRMTMAYVRSLTPEDLRDDIDNLNIDNFL